MCLLVDRGWASYFRRLLVSESLLTERKSIFSECRPLIRDSQSSQRMPTWGDLERHYYGVPGNERRGFKVGEDGPNDPFDPTTGDRLPSAERLQAARSYLSFRFPALRGAPLLESRVCQ